MKSSWKRSSAVLVLVALGAGGSPVFAQTAAPAAENDRGIADIVVTATRREENLNKIPLAIQALTGESLSALNITNFDKLIEFLPNVQAASQGPGTSSIYIRGLSTDTPGLQIVGTAGAAPNVALYLNDAPAATPGRNLDIYAADLQRVEVLAGPQGTLFGASSMGGAVRYITNKPDLKEFKAGFTASYAMTKGGEDSVAGQAYLNIPVIEDKFAIRLVVYNDQQGGYIDNIAGTYQMPFNGHVGEAGKLPEGNPLLVRRALESCTGIANCTGSNYRAPIRQTINNARFVEDNFNDASYLGGRIAATYQISDDWSIDFMHLRQRLKTDGVFNYEPGVGDLKVTQFNPNSLRDDTDLSTLTIKGRLGVLDLIYSGSYLNRTAVQKADYASYSNIGLFVPYYECDRGVYYTAAYNGNIGNTCYAPNKSYQVVNKNKRYTHEFRVSTPATERIRGTAGVFYDVNKLNDNTDWSYLQQAAGFIYPRRANPDVNPNDASVKPINVGFFNDVQRRDRQFAIFGEVAFDIVPEKLTLTLGGRYYNEKASQNGSSNTSFGFGSRGVYNPATGTYSAAATPPQFYGISANLNTVLKDVSPAKYTGFLKKANLTYKIDDRSLIYATYSEGFRPGGFNRKPCNIGSATCPTAADFAKLASYVPDEVKNYEIGAKISLLAVCILAGCGKSESQSGDNIRLHPQNGHYFEFRGKPTVLVGSTEHYAAVMNLDFNYLAGRGEIETEDSVYYLIMGLGNETRESVAEWNRFAPEWERLAAAEGLADPWETKAVPDLAKFPAGRSTYLLSGEAPADDSLAALDALHRYFDTHRLRLIADYAKRAEERTARELWLKEHPAVPQDTVINFWPKKSQNYPTGQ